MTLKNDVNLPSKIISKKALKKSYFLLASWRSLTKWAGSGAGSGSVIQKYGFPDLDLYQNVTVGSGKRQFLFYLIQNKCSKSLFSFNILLLSSVSNIECQQKTILDLTPQPRRLSGLRVDSEGFAISLMQSISKPTNYFSFGPFYHS